MKILNEIQIRITPKDKSKVSKIERYLTVELDSGDIIQQEDPRYRGTESWDFKLKKK